MLQTGTPFSSHLDPSLTGHPGAMRLAAPSTGYGLHFVCHTLLEHHNCTSQNQVCDAHRANTSGTHQWSAHIYTNTFWRAPSMQDMPAATRPSMLLCPAIW